MVGVLAKAEGIVSDLDDIEAKARAAHDGRNALALFDFARAADPAAVLELTAEVRRLRAENERLVSETWGLGSALEDLSDSEAEEAIRADLDAARAEERAALRATLRATAQRWQAFAKIHRECIDDASSANEHAWGYHEGRADTLEECAAAIRGRG
jgi:hypothetical protein